MFQSLRIVAGFHLYPLLLQATNDIDLIQIFLQVGKQHIEIPFRNGQTAMSKDLLERNDGTTH